MSNNQTVALSSVSEITIDNANEVLKILLHTASSDVSLSNIKHCDSAGIAALLEAQKMSAKQQVDLCYLDVPQQLRELADFLKVSDLLFH